MDINAPISLFPSLNQQMTIWLLLTMLKSGQLEYCFILWLLSAQTRTPEPPLQYGYYVSCDLVTDRNLL